ncbi:MAG TPA: OB-fold nucleic acid binding domain-containing protein, partial [Streptosporangiaceae bacterium]
KAERAAAGAAPDGASPPAAGAKPAAVAVAKPGPDGTGPDGAGPDGARPEEIQEAGLPPIVTAPRSVLRRRRRDRGPARRAEQAPPNVPTPEHHSYDRPTPSAGVSPIGSLSKPGRVTVEGRVRAVEIRPVERNSVLAADIADSTGDLTALFYGRSHIPGIVCGARIRFRGSVGIRAGGPVMINPAYELLSADPGAPPDGEDS